MASKRRNMFYQKKKLETTEIDPSIPRSSLKLSTQTEETLGTCAAGDYLKLFLHLDSGSVNEYTPWTGLLCGNRHQIPHVLYSSGPALVLEFHTYHIPSNSTGFIGSFRFIDKIKWGFKQVEELKVITEKPTNELAFTER
ncbi:hypothetical protein AAG570_006871 [Ranatra chinensis]|uniref:CUB domain-containing protein n=1 Tax=Ranatra chinensis TaxID=642074 RepID=A0ABD0YXH1_9HEMI